MRDGASSLMIGKALKVVEGTIAEPKFFLAELRRNGFVWNDFKIGTFGGFLIVIRSVTGDYTKKNS